MQKEVGSLANLLHFIARLETNHISYTIACNRPEAIMLTVAVPGERWEVEFLVDGGVETEIFCTSGLTDDISVLERLFTETS